MVNSQHIISVIIPTLNEGKYLHHLLHVLQECPLVGEIIVSDAGSTDDTQVVASNFRKTCWVEGSKGRAKQMNRGAAQASGEILLFLHADSRIQHEGITDIPDTLKTAIGGSFYIQFDIRHPLLSFYSFMSKVNMSMFTYGDQGLFLKRDTFNEIGGFKEIPIMEDYEMVRSLRRIGRFVKLKKSLITSARRFQKYGYCRQQIKNIFLVLGYKMGLKSAVLSRFYEY